MTDIGASIQHPTHLLGNGKGHYPHLTDRKLRLKQMKSCVLMGPREECVNWDATEIQTGKALALAF